FGLELEGLAPEDREFENAKAFVRFATLAAREAARLASRMDDITAAHTAIMHAARRYAPGLLATVSSSPAMGARHYAPRETSGRWVRVARNQVVLYGL